MDIGGHLVAINPKRSKDHEEVALSLKESWDIMRIPYFLQLDNQLSFRGSNRYPRFFGIVVKLCLLLGVEPIFIPLGEPWRNGCIEKFQDTFEHRFFRRIVFSDFKDLQNQAKMFEGFYKQNYRYSCLKGQTLKSRYINLIRFIRSNRMFDTSGEKFKVNKDLVYEYVRATIVVKERKIKFFHQDKLVDEIDYKLPG